MRIAICFSGGLRTFKLCYKDIVSHFEKIGQVDLFISTWDKPCYTQVQKDTDIHAINGDNSFDELLGKDETVTAEYLRTITNFAAIDIESMEVINNIVDITKNMKWTTMSPSRLVCQYYKMNRCNELKNKYADINNIKYDMNVRIRSDIKIQSIPEVFDLNKIYINDMVYVGCKVYRNNMLNEMIYIANNENMDKICKIYQNFMNVWWTAGYGEGVSFRHFKFANLLKDCVPYNFKISVHRACGKVESM